MRRSPEQGCRPDRDRERVQPLRLRQRGTKPRHADLLASDLDEIQLSNNIDRFLMYYIMTADKLTRTKRLAGEAGGRAGAP